MTLATRSSIMVATVRLLQAWNRTHLLLHVVQGIRGVDRETDEDDVGVGVGERTKAIVVFLAGSIPQRELNMLSVHLHIGHVVLEHGRDVDLITGKQAPRKRTRQRHVCTRRGRSWGRAEWETDLWEGSLGEDDQQTGLWAGA